MRVAHVCNMCIMTLYEHCMTCPNTPQIEGIWHVYRGVKMGVFWDPILGVFLRGFNGYTRAYWVWEWSKKGDTFYPYLKVGTGGICTCTMCMYV